MGGLIIACIALAVVCLFLLAQKVLLNHRIRKLAEQVDGFNSGTAEMLDVALAEDRLAQLHNGIAAPQLSLTKISFSVHIYAIQINEITATIFLHGEA